MCTLRGQVYTCSHFKRNANGVLLTKRVEQCDGYINGRACTWKLFDEDKNYKLWTMCRKCLAEPL